MTRIALATLLVLHGFIHLFGFVKAFGVADVPQLAEPIPPAAGLLWLVAAMLSFATAALLLTRRWWWVFGAGAVVISQAAILSSWGDAKVGTVVNVVLLVAVGYGFASRGPLSLRAEFEGHLRSVWPSVRSGVAWACERG